MAQMAGLWPGWVMGVHQMRDPGDDEFVSALAYRWFTPYLRGKQGLTHPTFKASK